jgi:UDP-3-O-[3-hydroxymyristoyl] N-acetylglucosamine deacetylase
MHALRKQRTIARSVSVTGFGFWSGRDTRLEFHPAEADTGIVFVRTDLSPPVRIQAVVANRIETPRRTTLSAGGASVEMIEHVMAALGGLQIDNCEIHVDQPEMPGCDGSSLPFVAALDSAGAVEQTSGRPQLVVRNITRLGNDESWIEARPGAGGALSIKFRLDYGSGNAIGRQTLQLLITPESFRRELAASRTFVLQDEAEWLVSRGLGKRTTPRDLLVFDKDGPMDNELRYRDECVRHKTLDLIGDLALAGCDLVGHIIAHRSGHRLNAELVRALRNEEEILENRRRSA